MRVYLEYRTTIKEQAERCVTLVNKAAAQTMVELHARLDENELENGVWGCAVGRGEDAGLNAGAAEVEIVRSNIVEGNDPWSSRLTNAERTELLAFIQQAPSVHADWYWNPDSPDYQFPPAP